MVNIHHEHYTKKLQAEISILCTQINIDPKPNSSSDNPFAAFVNVSWVFAHVDAAVYLSSTCKQQYNLNNFSFEVVVNVRQQN